MTEEEGAGFDNDVELLHIFAQPTQHDEAYIVGNRLGLTRLRDAIDAALEQRGAHDAAVCANDGEGYAAVVVFGEMEQMNTLALPYTEWIGTNREPGEDLWPGQMPSVKRWFKTLLERRTLNAKHDSGDAQ